jgi:glycine hydroxymethyltransferase
MSTNAPSATMRTLADADPEIADAIARESHRQETGLELIASENFVSAAVSKPPAR